ncbi:MAG: SurA N-terminal domain-containing protein [Magnetococcales bacterium]|nr:SurA N-terminal domain-containing protein [Magnetococcales bacterium]
MLNILRKGANTFIVKLLLFFIALSFVVWGVGDYVNKSNRVPLVEAKRWTIGPREFAVAYDGEFQRLRQRFGNTLDKKTAETLGLKQKTLNSMINRHLILAKSRELRLTLSDISLRTIIADTPAFQEAGKFDPRRYELVLQNNRLAPRDYEQNLRTDAVVAQLQEMISSPLTIPNLLIDDIFDLNSEKRAVEVLTLPYESFHAGIQPTDAELATYLEKNQKRYLSPIQVRLQYVLLTTDSVRDAVTVTDAEIDEYYNEHKEEYRQEEKRQARHILFKIGHGVTEAQAREKADAARDRIEKGEAFETVARERSDDVTAAQGGDLGIISRGMMIKPFEDAVFSQETGKVSSPLLTPFGIHLIRVDEIFPEKMRPAQEVKTEIKALITERKASDLVYERSSVMEDQVIASGDLKAVAQDLNLRYKETGFISLMDSATLDQVEQDKKFLDAAFTTTKGELSPLTELSEGRFCVIKVVDRKEPQPLPMAEIKDRLLNDYKQEKSVAMAREQMESIRKNLVDGTPWEKVKETSPALKSDLISPFLRSGQTPKIESDIREATFKLTMESPIFRNVIEKSDGLALIRLAAIEKADRAKLTEQERKKIAIHIRDNLAREQLAAYLDGLWNAAGIRINHQVLDQF